MSKHGNAVLWIQLSMGMSCVPTGEHRGLLEAEKNPLPLLSLITHSYLNPRISSYTLCIINMYVYPCIYVHTWIFVYIIESVAGRGIKNTPKKPFLSIPTQTVPLPAV